MQHHAQVSGPDGVFLPEPRLLPRGSVLPESGQSIRRIDSRRTIVGAFCAPGSAVWNSPTNASVLGGLAVFNVSFTAADTNHPLAQVDLFVDGIFVRTLTNLAPSPGNTFSVTIDGVTATYTATNGDSLGSAAIGLGSALAAQQNATDVQSYPVGDRLVLRSTNVATPGGQMSVRGGATAGSAPALTSFVMPAEPTFLDSTAYGYHVVEASNNPGIGDWLQLTLIKTNGVPVTVAATNTQTGATINSLLQALMDQINGDPALQTADGATASDLIEVSNGVYGFLVNAGSPGWMAAQIQTIFTGSTNLSTFPAGTNALEDNVGDLQPRVHIYLSCGAVSLPLQFALDTTAFTDGFHDLTVVAYEGTSVRTQTRAHETVQFRNTALSAAFSTLGADTNGNLLFGIAANATNIARIELFSTGGSVAVATNEASADLAASAATLGAGLHPFYAVVTDANGHQYRTQAAWEQVPALQLSIAGPPQSLSWAAIAGRQYSILAATNLGGPFEVVGTVPATNGQAQWRIPVAPSGPVFYRVSLPQ